MNRRRRLFQALTLAFAVAALLFTLVPQGTAFGQMDRSGVVGIQNDTERQLFWSLLCTCGCPRETLGTCTCGFAHARRNELRAALAEGKSIEQIKEAYVKTFGTQALAVPPNTGSQRAVWLVPLLLIAVGGGVVAMILRRWVKRDSNEKPATEPAREQASGDDNYDAKLDEELKALDRE